MVWHCEVSQNWIPSTIQLEQGDNFESFISENLEPYKNGLSIYDLEIHRGREIGFLDSELDLIAYVDWAYLYNTENFVLVTPEMVCIDHDYRGESLALELYRYTMSFNWVIQAADIFNIQSKGGSALWRKLQSVPDITMMVKESIFHPAIEVKSFSEISGFDIFNSDAVIMCHTMGDSK